MANKEIPDLPAASALSGAELVPGDQGGATVKITVSQIAALAPLQDHNLLTNLTAGDAHPQYHNNARGDARYPLQSTAINAGNGLQGGGDLSATRTLSAKATATRGITVTVNGIEVDIVGCGVLPESVDASNDLLLMWNASEARPRAVNFATALAGASGFVPVARQIASGSGLTGGGDLSVDRTLAVGAGAGITVDADSVALDTASTRNVDHSAVSILAGTGISGGGTIAADRTISLDTSSSRNVDHASITIAAGTGLTGGGDISANRTLSIDTNVVATKTGSNTFTGQRQSISHNTPLWALDESDQVSGERMWAWLSSGKVMGLRAYDDTFSSSVPILQATRGAGQAVTQIDIGSSSGAPTVNVNGVSVRDAAILSTGTLANARVSVANVTQHQASLTIAWSQISGTKNADQLQGAVSSENSDASSIAKRTSTGILRASSFQGGETNNDGATITQFYVNNGIDGFHRRASIAQAQAALGIGAATFNGATVYPSGNQTINNNSITILSFDTEELDQGGWHDNVTGTDRLTVPSGVTYARFTGNVTFDLPDGTAYSDIYVMLYKNGSTYKQFFGPTSTGEGNNIVSVAVDSGPVQVAAGNYFQLGVYALAGSGNPQFVINSLNFRTQFSAQKLG